MELATEFLYQIVDTYSPSRQEDEIAARMVKFMKQQGFSSAERDKTGNVIGEIGNGSKTILLAGHMDTVPGKLPVKITNNILYGRGSVDAKGTLAAFVLAALQFKQSEQLKVVVLGTVEEELDGAGIRGFIKENTRPIDYIVVGEPNHWDRINLGYKGSIYVEYELTKAITHTAHPEPTATEEALVFSNVLRRWAKQFNEDKLKAFDKLNFSIRGINTFQNGLDETIHVTINFRTPLGFNFEALKEVVEQAREKGQVRYHGEEHAIRCSKNNELVGALLRAIRDHGGEPKFVVKTGTSDMNPLGQAFGTIPMVTYGPGDSSLDHTPDECIELGEYQKSIAVLVALMQHLSS